LTPLRPTLLERTACANDASAGFFDRDASSGAFSKASRAPGRALTLTPLSTFVAAGMLLVVVIFPSPVLCRPV
jgi:hypothetical protein